MRCCLEDVDVYEMRELTLDSWCDLERFLDGAECLRNRELLALVHEQPKRLKVCRNVTKECCAPLSHLLARPDGTTALHLAVAVPDNLRCVQLVCSALQDAAAAARDGMGRTALQLAVDLGHADAAQFLVQRFRGWGQLSHAQLCRAVPWVCGAGDRALVEAVCRAAGCAAAAQRGLVEACRHNQTDCIDLLIGSNADAGAADEGGGAPLMAAAENGHVACVAALIDRRAEVDRAHPDGGTALMAAAHRGHTACVKALLALRADVARAKHDGWTPLMAASQNGHLACVEALVGRGADAARATANGWTALMAAAQNGHVSCVRALVAHGAAVGAADREGWTALMVAAQSARAPCIEALMAHGADASQVSRDGRTALHWAALTEHACSVQTLLTLRADVAAADAAGQTALMDAAQSGYVDCLTALLLHKADVDAAHGTGQTALMWAALGGHAACVEALLGHRADVGARNNGGWTALMGAAHSGSGACVAALTAHCGGDGPGSASGGALAIDAEQERGLEQGPGLGPGMVGWVPACPRCGAGPRLLRHIATYNGGFYVCDVCGRDYTTAGGVYHCECGWDACRCCMGIGGLLRGQSRDLRPLARMSTGGSGAEGAGQGGF